MNTVRIFKRKKNITKEVYSGKLMLRVDPETHKSLSIKAQEMGVSINLLLNMLIDKGIKTIDED